jgi:hypothetical protein
MLADLSPVGRGERIIAPSSLVIARSVGDEI